MPKIPENTYQEVFNKHKNKIQFNNSTTCWEWIGNRNSYGYSLVKYNNKQTQAHKLIYSKFFNLNLFTLKDLHHICENRRCVNPMHLKQVDRSSHRNFHLYIKIKNIEVKELKDLYLYGFNTVELGAIYNLHPSSARNILVNLSVTMRRRGVTKTI